MAPLVIPGYSFDGKKYYKLVPGAKPAPPPPAPTRKASTTMSSRERKKARRALDRGKMRAIVHEPLGVRNMYDSHLGPASRERLHRDLDGMGMGRMRKGDSLWPDCLLVGESVFALSFDDLDPSVVRVGGSMGTIATGSLSRDLDEDTYFPNDPQGWRTGWVFPSRITSLQTCGDRILATCLGAPAQAIVGTTRDNMSLASVTLSPRKTDLWTSALSRDIVALGCSSKVLISRDPSRHTMDGYVTGGKNGDGSVFSLDLTENLIFAGTRSGKVKIFDQRASPTSHGSGDTVESRAEMQLQIGTSVTHARRVKDGLLVAGIDGSLGMYDLRVLRPMPYVTMAGHVNSYTRDIGLDVWRDDFVAAGGQDGKVKIWSLGTGAAIVSPPSSSDSLFTNVFQEPVTVLKFTGSDRMSNERRDDGTARGRRELESKEGWKEGTGPKLYVGDGFEVLSYRTQGMEAS